MPLYEYLCRDCGREVTIWRSFSETSRPSCPVCGGGDVSRLISRVSIIKSEKDRTRDVSWIDRDLGQRLRRKARRKLNPDFEETLTRMELE